MKVSPISICSCYDEDKRFAEALFLTNGISAIPKPKWFASLMSTVLETTLAMAV